MLLKEGSTLNLCPSYYRIKREPRKYAMQIRKIYLKFAVRPSQPSLASFFFFCLPFTRRIIASRRHEAERKSRSTRQRDEKFPEIYYREQRTSARKKERERNSGLKPRKVMPNQSAPRCSITIEGVHTYPHAGLDNKTLPHTDDTRIRR